MSGFGKDFQVNIKCVVIAGGVAWLYWIAPPKDWKIVLAILVLGYIAIAWYDKWYNCSNKMKYTGSVLGQLQAPFKPKVNPTTMEYGG
jgi:hypothetical protein